MEAVFRQTSSPLQGELRVPSDKSLSHRAVLFASLAEGHSHLKGVLDSEDVRATIRACEVLGARIHFEDEGPDGLRLRVTGWGLSGPEQPDIPVDCGNSGTTARLLMGALSGFPIDVTLTGDASLSRRPMQRVIDPLSRMGATFEFAQGHTLPVTVHGTGTLQPLAYASPVASAQVKTAILLAGLRACGVTRVTEPTLSRDHTERLLPAFGIGVTTDDAPGAAVNGPAVPVGHDVSVPGDPSSAAFIVSAALLVPDSRVHVRGVSLNPTRIGFLRVLERMGARLRAEQTGSEGTEPVGDIAADYSSGLTAVTVSTSEVPSLIDEVPILALVAACAHGTTRFEGVGELRVKESDRLDAVARGLQAFGVSVRAGDDWLEVDGPAELLGPQVSSLGDHRLAMTWAVGGLVAQGATRIDRFEAINVSYPDFVSHMTALGAEPGMPA